MTVKKDTIFFCLLNGSAAETRGAINAQGLEMVGEPAEAANKAGGMTSSVRVKTNRGQMMFWSLELKTRQGPSSLISFSEE
jgi:hypothetical protein